MRVFLGVAEIAGYYRGLREGFREIGVACTFIDLGRHPFGYGGDDRPLLVKWIHRLMSKPGRLRRLCAWALRGIVFLQVVPFHDVFIFSFGTTLLPRNLDLPILRLLGKRVICQYHGSDSRPPFFDGSVIPSESDEDIRRCITLTAVKKREIARVERWADVIVDTPPQGLFHEKPFVLWLRVGLPSRPSRIPPPPPIDPAPDPAILRILHSPSVPHAKGSDRIRRIVEDLRARGLPVELVEIRNRPNHEVLEELERSAFVIDQMWADYAMPGFATEAAWFGKAVIIGGYAKDLWDSALPPEWVPPTHYCRPEDLPAAIERLVRDRSYRHELGRRARAFVEEKWNPAAVAARYLRLAKGDIPADWMWDPAKTRYWQGACLPEERVRERIAKVIRTGGLEALQLGDKAGLEALFASVGGAEGTTPIARSS